MSDGGAHVGLSSSPILTGAVFSGGLGVDSPLHSAFTPSLIIRGGGTPVLIANAPSVLPKPGLVRALFGFGVPLAPNFQAAASSLPFGRRLVDLLGGGDCGFNCLAGGLMLLGLLACTDLEKRQICCSPNLVVPYGRLLRSRIVAHARLPRVLSSVVTSCDATEVGGAIPFAHAVMSSLASWPELERLLPQHKASFSVDGWCSLMSLSSGDGRPGTYLDEAGLLAAADCYLLRIVCYIIDASGVEQPMSPQTFLPLSGRAPQAEIRLWLQPDAHFVLEVAALSESTGANDWLTPVMPSSDMQSWLHCCETVCMMGNSCARAQGTALAARNNIDLCTLVHQPGNGYALYAAVLERLTASAKPTTSRVSRGTPHRPEEMEELATDLAEAHADKARAFLEEEEPTSAEFYTHVGAALASSDAGANSVALAPKPPLMLPGPPCEMCGWRSIASWRVPEPCSSCGIRLCDACHKLHNCIEIETSVKPAIPLTAGSMLASTESGEVVVGRKRARIEEYLIGRKLSPQPQYLSACVLLFGISAALHSAAVLLVCFRASPHAAQAISELREEGDATELATALRGVAEELLGFSEGSSEAAACVVSFTRRLDQAGFLARHLGANPSSKHRSLALPANLLFDGGLDEALASFRVNAEMGSAFLAPLRGITGQPWDTTVSDGVRRHHLRDGRYLGAGRITFIKRYLGRRTVLWSPSPTLLPSPLGTSGLASSEFTSPEAGIDYPSDAALTATLEAEWLIAANLEWQSFSWPLTTVAEVERLLQCSYIAPTDIVGFEFSGALRQALETVGRRALSVDHRACEVGGMHAVLDVRDVAPLARWQRAFMFPPCFQQLRADEDCLQAKIDDGRAFWGCALVIWCFCIAADLLVVEQPDTIVADFFPLDFFEARTSAFGDAPDKYVRLYLYNCALVAPFEPDPAARRRPPHYLAYPNSDARDRAKSTWRPFVSLCRALARLLPAAEPAPASLDYVASIERFASAWHRHGFPVPREYHNARALPPLGSRRYQAMRGPGDGRLVDAVVPAGIVQNGLRGGAATNPTEQLTNSIDVRTATEYCAMLLFVATLLQPLVYAHVNGFTLQGVLLPEASTRTSYVRAVQPLVSASIAAAGTAVFMVGEYIGGARLLAAPLDFRPPRDRVCTSRTSRLALLAAGGCWAWMSLAALAGTPVCDAAQRSVLACEAFIKPGHVLADFPSEALEAPLVFRTGAAIATSVLSRPTLAHIASPPAWRAIAASARDSQLLIDALNHVSEDVLLAGWVDRIKPLDPSDIPESLLKALPGFDDVCLEHQPFSPIYEPLVTPWMPLPPPQASASPAVPACVRSPFEMMLPATQTLVTAWLRHALRDLKDLHDATEAGTAQAFADGRRRRDRPRPLAIGRFELHEWARDRVWDCRAQCCRLLDFTAPIRTHLNLDYLRERLHDYPDQHLVSNLLEGVRLDADVELQSVFVPHLVSLPLGYRSVEKELRRLQGLGWYTFFPEFPFWPIYLNGQGSAARKLEPDRYRRTTEGGGPRQPTFDLEGLQAISINAASFIPHVPAHFVRDERPEMAAWLEKRGLSPSATKEPLKSRSKWPKEIKPNLGELMHDLAILKRAAHLLNAPVYIFGDDAKDYFNQLAMAECELHKTNIVFLAKDGDVLGREATTSHVPTLHDTRLIFVSELRLGFGTHGASNIAQRFSEALLSMFREDMDREDLPFFNHPSSELRQWLNTRQAVARELASADCELSACPDGPTDESVQRHYSEQRRLWAVWCYTDDPIWIVVGVDRTLRALRVWRRLTDQVGLLMAIPEKRNLGTHAVWLGVLILTTLGIVVVPKSKLLRAAAAISGALKGSQPFHVYRSLLGLLEHLRAVNLRGRNVMHGLYAPHRPTGASRFGPNGRVQCDELMIKQLHRWRDLLQHSAGVSVRRAFSRKSVELALTGITVFASSDACFGDPDPDGIGGFCHGLYWHFLVPLSDADVLSTPVLEFLGVAFNILNFCEHASSLCGSTGTLLLTTDALTTAMVLPRESQQSPMMTDAYQLLTETTAWQQMLPRLRVRHNYGESMFLADPLSRSRWSEFRSRCRQLGVQPLPVPLAAECGAIFQMVVQLERARRLAATRLTTPVRAGASFLERLKRPPTVPVSEPNWLHRRLTNAPSTVEKPLGGFLQRLLERPLHAIKPPPTPSNVVVAGLPMPTPPPRPTAAAPSPSRLHGATNHYARLRAAALVAGPDPAMHIRADLADLYRASEAVSELSEFGANSNTLRKDDRAWEFWEHICEQLNASPFRSAEDVRTNPERQAFLLAVLMLYASAVCVPRTPGRHCIKPRSALAYPLAIIRIFNRWGIRMPGFKALQGQLAGLQRAYIAYHGPKSLAPKRAEPMRFSMVRDMHGLQCDGSLTIGRRRWNDNDQAVFMFRRLSLLMMRGGWRLAEWVFHSSGEIMYICRSDLWWRINGVIVKDPTPEQLRNLRPGDCAFVAPPRSKPDQWGEIHCSFPVVYVFTYDADNAAAALRDIELRHPCHGAQREVTPVIEDEHGNPYTHSVLDTILHNVLVHLYGAAMASLFSWHSYRSGLCTALFAAKCPDAINQLICRWMCPESLYVYRRLGTLQNADWVECAANARVDSIQSGNAPKVSNDESYSELFRDTCRTRGSPLMQDWLATQTDVTRHVRPDAPPSAATPSSSALTQPQPPLDTSAVPLTATNVVGRRVLVPAAVYPQEACAEIGGTGWECLVVGASRVSAVVRFLNARTADGRSYADARLPLSALKPMA